jgi:hypothetical protein
MSTWSTKAGIETLKDLFINNQVDRIEWIYSAGGDSLNETETVGYLGDEEVDVKEHESIIDDFALDNTDIADSSDGHYEGESGTVTITYDAQEDVLVTSKDFESHWNESYEEEDYINITSEEKEILSKIDVFKVEIPKSSYEEILFKEDTYVSKEMHGLLESITEKMIDVAMDFEPSKGDGETNEYMTIQFEEVVEDMAKVTIHYTVQETKDGYGDN